MEGGELRRVLDVWEVDELRREFVVWEGGELRRELDVLEGMDDAEDGREGETDFLIGGYNLLASRAVGLLVLGLLIMGLLLLGRWDTYGAVEGKCLLNSVRCPVCF